MGTNNWGGGTLRSKGKRTVEERFWPKVSKGSGVDDCWLWNRCCDKDGYGWFVVNRKMMGAHRFSWVLANGEIPDGLWVLHNCPAGDNPGCVNPAHLWLGTPQQNVNDMIAKGRHPVKFTTDTVVAVRERYAEGGIRQYELAAQFDVRQPTISRIVRRTLWAHVPTNQCVAV